MKKIIVFAFFSFLCLQINAQRNKQFSDVERTSKRHEIKLNALTSILAIPEVSYEYLLNDESGIGASILIGLNDDSDLNFAFTPYYRFYFGKKTAAGFFLEGFGMYSNQDNNVTTIFGEFSNGNQNTTNDFALGIGLGGKFLSKKGFIGELSLGVGRNLFGNHYEEAVGRIGITLGKRF